MLILETFFFQLNVFRNMTESIDQVHSSNIVEKPHKYLYSIISKTAFRLYGHWIKRGRLENRGSLHANTPKKQKNKSAIDNLL